PSKPKRSRTGGLVSPPHGRAWAALALVLALAAPARAQREQRMPAPAETPIPFLTTCVAPLARFAAVNDAGARLAVGHRPKTPAHLTIVKLDDQGLVAAGEPVAITLPKPPALGDRPNHVLGLASHPRFPLLYVWQDVPPPDEPPGAVIDPAASAEF